MFKKIKEVLNNSKTLLSMKEISDIINEPWQEVDKCLLEHITELDFIIDSFNENNFGWTLKK